MYHSCSHSLPTTPIEKREKIWASILKFPQFLVISIVFEFFSQDQTQVLGWLTNISVTAIEVFCNFGVFISLGFVNID